MSLGVVLAVVTDAPAALPRGQPHAQVEVAALGVAVAAALWRGQDNVLQAFAADTVIMGACSKPIWQCFKPC